MRAYIFIIGVNIYFFTLNGIHASKKCYEAKICIHNGKEKCGQDKNGRVRRFFDSCDIKEYNCLRNTEYIRTHREKCKSLPPLSEEREDKSKEGSEERLPHSSKSEFDSNHSKGKNDSVHDPDYKTEKEVGDNEEAENSEKDNQKNYTGEESVTNDSENTDGKHEENENQNEEGLDEENNIGDNEDDKSENLVSEEEEINDSKDKPKMNADDKSQEFIKLGYKVKNVKSNEDSE